MQEESIGMRPKMKGGPSDMMVMLGMAKPKPEEGSEESTELSPEITAMVDGMSESEISALIEYCQSKMGGEESDEEEEVPA